MKRILTAIIIGLLSFSILAVLTPQVKAAETTIFSDDFESYSTNTFPSAGGWVLVYNGMGTQYQIVTDVRRYSGTKSLQLWGQSWWSARAWKGFQTTAAVIGYEEAIMISERNANPSGTPFERTCFYNKDIPEWGRQWAEVRFYHTDLTIRSEGYPGTVLGTWTPGTWYNVRAILDRATNKYSVWINGQLKGSELTLEYQDTDHINGIGPVSEHPGVKVYYDNIRVFTVAQMPAAREARGVFIRFSAEEDGLFYGAASDQITETFAKQRIDYFVQDLYSHNLNTIFVSFKSDGGPKGGQPASGIIFYPSNNDLINDLMGYQRFSDMYAQSFDPMNYLISQSHGKGIEVHAWIPIFRDAMFIQCKTGLGYSEEVRQLATVVISAYPFTKTYPSNEFVEPKCGDVQEYEIGLIKEIVQKYPLDGINLDYLRYTDETPNEPLMVDSLYWWPKDSAQVVKFVKDVSSWLRANYPKAVLSADVLTDGPLDLITVGQDIGGISNVVDVLMPMTYHRFWLPYLPEWVGAVTTLYKNLYNPRYIVPCIQAWIDKWGFSSQDIIDAVSSARSASADGFALFTYESDKKELGGPAALNEILEGHAEVPWASTSATAIRITANSPVNTLVTAPNGLRVGYDSSTHDVVNEIEGATYSGPGTESQVTTIPEPLPGDYEIDVFGVGTGSYAITVESIAPDGSAIDTRTWTGETYPEKLESNSVPLLKDGNLRDLVPPWTTLSVGLPQFVDSSYNRYISSETPFDLTSFDNLGGEGVASTTYSVYNDTYGSDWTIYSQPFHLAGLTDGSYHIDYSSSDNAGNVESTKNATVILDNTAPKITDTNFEDLALQDGVTLEVSAWDLSAVASVTFTIQCTQGETVDSGPAKRLPNGRWGWYFNTTRHPEGPYVAIVTATDVLGNSDDAPPIDFTIRNWAAQAVTS